MSAHVLFRRAFLLPGARAKIAAIAFIVFLLAHVSGSTADPPTAVPATGDPEIAALSEQAKNRFRRRMNPPAPYLTLLQIVQREETQAARDYAARAFEAALDSLTAEAGRSAQAEDAVKAALRKFVATGRAGAADALFADMIERVTTRGQNDTQRAAMAIRGSVALVELPAALASMIKLPGEALPFAPLGEKALPAYRRAAALDPDDPWTWIAIAWMEQARGAPVNEAETAIDAAEQAALAAGDVKATITALQTRGQLRAAQNRFDDAAQALREAVRLSETQMAEQPGALADLALHLNLLGDLHLRRGDTAGAASAFERAFTLRQRLAATSPDDQTAQLNVAASHVRLAQLASQSGRAGEADRHWNEGFAIYHAVASRDRFMPTFDAAQPGSVVQVFVLAGVLTLVGGVILLARYRRAVDRLMKAAASAGRGAATSGAVAPIIGTEAPIELAIRTVSVSEPRSILARLFPGRGTATPRSAPMAGAKRALQRAALVQVLAGVAFAAVATILTFIYGDIDNPVRAALFFWSWAWPVVIVLGLLWARDHARMALVLGMYLGGLLMICVTAAAGDIPPRDFFGISVPPFFQPLIFWAQTFIYSLFLLFFLNRHVRSVGPVLLVFMLIASIGGLLAQVAMSTYAAWRAFSVVSITLGLPPLVIFLLATPLGMMVLALPAWWVIGRIRRAYQAKRISELTLMFDAIWLFQTLFLCQSLIFEVGLQGWIGLAAFASYKLVATVGAWPLASEAARRPAAKLLLLRVFGFRKRTERLFDVLGGRWRFAGPIQMIAAPDLAAKTIDPGEFMDFLSGRLRRRFIIEPGDLQQRLAEIDLRPDADGRFRVNDIFCGNDTWQAAVESLMAETDLVAMDLRGFSPQNKGCVYELQMLLDTVPTSRIVVFADRSTDVAFLKRTLADCARAMAPTSRNRSSGDPLTVLNIGENDRSAVHALLGIADAALAGPGPSGSLAVKRCIPPGTL